LTVGGYFRVPPATVIHENVKFSNRRQKGSYNDMLINVAAQHFFATAPRHPGLAAILSIFAPILMVSSKVDFVPFRHSVLDTESSEFSHLWITAFAGMTVFGLLTSSSIFAD
jgi:hypothetical protein